MIRNTKGFTLMELLVGVIVMGIVGVALTRILVADSRFVERTEAMLNARQASRAAMNMMLSELAMVGNGGLTAASGASITLRVPYAFGILCDAQGANRLAWLMPTDSMVYANSSADGVAWRDGLGVYTFMNVSSVAPASSGQLTNNCTNEGITIDSLTDGTGVRMKITNDTLSIGDVFYLYQTIKYEFKTSVEMPGRIGLWRQQGSTTDEELLAPFDSTASFGFFLTAVDTAQATPPADLSTVVALELNLAGSSEVTPQGSSAPPSFMVSTRVNFLNNQ